MKGPDLKNYRKISKFSVGVSCAFACLMFQYQVAVHAEEIAPEVGQENHLNQDEKVNDVENNVSSDTETGTESLAEAGPILYRIPAMAQPVFDKVEAEIKKLK